MRPLKTFLKSQAVQAAAAFVLSLYIRFVFLTSKKTRHVDAAALPYMRGEQNAIFAFWHGRMMLLPAFNPPRKMHVLISQHRDGVLISRTIGHFNQDTVSGSSSRGGKEAAGHILRLLQQGDNVSITPDGPRGPAQVAAKGVATLARLAGKPVLPITFASTREKRMRSWDRFALARPFGHIHFYAGAPIVPSKGTDADTLRQQVEQAMNAQVEQAERAARA